VSIVAKKLYAGRKSVRNISTNLKARLTTQVWNYLPSKHVCAGASAVIVIHGFCRW